MKQAGVLTYIDRSLSFQGINGIPPFGPPRVWRCSQRGICIDSSVSISTNRDLKEMLRVHRGKVRWRGTGSFFLFYLVQMPHRFVSARERHTIDLRVEAAHRNLPPLSFKRPKSVTLESFSFQSITASLL